VELSIPSDLPIRVCFDLLAEVADHYKMSVGELDSMVPVIYRDTVNHEHHPKLEREVSMFISLCNLQSLQRDEYETPLSNSNVDRV
jgi:hypothetical protein